MSTIDVGVSKRWCVMCVMWQVDGARGSKPVQSEVNHVSETGSDRSAGRVNFFFVDLPLACVDINDEKLAKNEDELGHTHTHSARQVDR